MPTGTPISMHMAVARDHQRQRLHRLLPVAQVDDQQERERRPAATSRHERCSSQASRPISAISSSGGNGDQAGGQAVDQAAQRPGDEVEEARGVRVEQIDQRLDPARPAGSCRPSASPSHSLPARVAGLDARFVASEAQMRLRPPPARRRRRRSSPRRARRRVLPGWPSASRSPRRRAPCRRRGCRPSPGSPSAG